MNEAQVRHDLIDPALRAAGYVVELPEDMVAEIAAEAEIVLIRLGFESFRAEDLDIHG